MIYNQKIFTHICNHNLFHSILRGPAPPALIGEEARDVFCKSIFEPKVWQTLGEWKCRHLLT